jgi:hypothetical protein
MCSKTPHFGYEPRNVLAGVRYESRVLVPSLVGDVDVSVRRLNQRGRDDRASVEVRPPRGSALEIGLAVSANGHQVGRVFVVQIPKVPGARCRRVGTSLYRVKLIFGEIVHGAILPIQCPIRDLDSRHEIWSRHVARPWMGLRASVAGAGAALVRGFAPT